MTEFSGGPADPALPLNAEALRIARGGGLASCLRGEPGARKGRSGYCGTTSEQPGPGSPADAMTRTAARAHDETIQNQP
jgi:hypothetical protein